MKDHGGGDEKGELIFVLASNCGWRREQVADSGGIERGIQQSTDAFSRDGDYPTFLRVPLDVSAHPSFDH